MADSILDNRTRIRPRIDETVLHKSAIVDGTTTTSIVRLDIVVAKVTMFVPSTLTANLYGAIDGSNFFTLESGVSNGYYSYGDSPDDHLIKFIKVERTAGSGVVIIAGTQKSYSWPGSSLSAFRTRQTDNVHVSDTVTTDFWKGKNLTDSINIVDPAGNSNIANKSLRDTVTTTDTVTNEGPPSQNLMDNVTMPETTDKSIG
jgi:hypothetical protein